MIPPDDDSDDDIDDGEENGDVFAEDGDAGLDEEESDDRWFSKVGPFIDHVRKVVKGMATPGSRLSLDEMMLRFFGRSANTFRMNNKPIKEGYKVMAVACAFTGFVFALTPDGRLGSDGEVDITGRSKIDALVVHLAKELPPPVGFHYVLTMDNYFTTPKTMKALRDMKIGGYGTARARVGWPPKEIKAVTDGNFNSCYYTVDDVGTMVYRWVDNNVVTFVSTVHGKQVSVPAERKKPRLTSTNRSHVNAVWGDDYVKTIEIPEFINDYNHTMNAVDRADQLIAAYTMKHKCRRTWLPFLLYLVNIIRVNSYVAHRELGGEMSHMDFALGLAMDMWDRRNEGAPRTRGAEAVLPGSRKPVFKRMRLNVDPLPEARLRNPELHKAPFYEWKRACFYCRWRAAKARIEGKEPNKVNKVSRGCSQCGDLAICKHCWDEYHSEAV